jgi:lipoteichoic acid synthase
VRQALRQLGRLFCRPLAGRRELAELLSLMAAICLAILTAKAVLAHMVLANAAMPPQVVDEDRLASWGRILAGGAEDVAVGLGCLFLGGLAFACSSRAVWRWLLRAVIYLLALLALVFLAINVVLFQKMRAFLTLAHIQFAGGAGLERSVAEEITPSVKLLLVLLPLGTLAVHLWWLRTFPRFWQSAAQVVGRPVVLTAAIVGLSLAACAAQNTSLFETSSDFAQDPYLLFVRSLLVGPDMGLLAETTEEDADDFQPGRPGLTPGLLSRPPRNIVLIVLESVPTCYLDLYGAPLPVTPRLRQLQEKGIVFDNFYATANYTIASALPLFASTYNDTRAHSTPEAHPDFPVAGAGAWLQKQGYKTYFLAAGGSGTWESYRQGKMIDFYLGPDQFQVARDPGQSFWARTAEPQRFLSDDYGDREMFADGKRVLRQAKGQKFFLMMWNYATHYRYHPEGGPETFDERCFPPAVRSDPELKQEFVKYLRAIWCADQYLADFYDELERLGLADDTLVVVTADHGEAFYQHSFPFHGSTLYEEEVHVPLLMLCPRLAPLGRHNRTIGSHVDLWPTIMDLCGLPCDPRWQGRSLFSKRPTDQQRAYFYRVDIWLGVRQGRYKYLWNFRDRREQLFDLENDPGERTNLAAEQPELCAELRRRLVAWVHFEDRWTRACVRQGFTMPRAKR